MPATGMKKAAIQRAWYERNRRAEAKRGLARYYQMKEDPEKYAAYLAQKAKTKKARRQLESRLGIKPEPPTDEQKAIRNEKARLSQANARASMTEAQRSAERARNRERMAKYRAEQRALKSNVEANRPPTARGTT